MQPAVVGKLKSHCRIMMVKGTAIIQMAAKQMAFTTCARDDLMFKIRPVYYYSVYAKST
jgi:hypothetical protein